MGHHHHTAAELPSLSRKLFIATIATLVFVVV